MAAIHSASSGAETLLLESNNTAGRKLLLTGSGRCNFTHLATAEEIARVFGNKGRSLSYSLHKFPPQLVQLFFQKRGLKSKVEEDGCVFPATDRAADVRNILLTEAKKNGVQFIFSAKVKSIDKHGQYFTVEGEEQKIHAEKVIIATGGISYPETGSKGDGYRFAQHLGHTIIQPRASLVPLVTLESWPNELAGISLDNVKISVAIGKKKFITTGAVLFTHDGIGGPAALELSRFLTDFLPIKKKPIKINIDLVSNTNEDELEQMILRQISEHPKKTIANILSEIVPRRISQVLCGQLNFPENLPVLRRVEGFANQLNRDARRKLLHILKAVPLSIVCTRPIEEAMVTRGGVNITEVEPKTMESKICPGLFFAGEVLDVDGPCGGYNLQMCWSTGALAGLSAASK